MTLKKIFKERNSSCFWGGGEDKTEKLSVMIGSLSWQRLGYTDRYMAQNLSDGTDKIYTFYSFINFTRKERKNRKQVSSIYKKVKQ